MRRPATLKSRSKLFAAATVIALATTLGVAVSALAETKPVNGTNEAGLFDACGKNGGLSYLNVVAYGCILPGGIRIDCVYGHSCYGTTARLIGGTGRLRALGINVTPARSLRAWPHNVCSLCYQNCGFGPLRNHICTIHCQTRGGCPPPTRGLASR
jgi:hypothetical protein